MGNRRWDTAQLLARAGLDDAAREELAGAMRGLRLSDDDFARVAAIVGSNLAPEEVAKQVKTYFAFERPALLAAHEKSKRGA